jgi:hypothetical protein
MKSTTTETHNENEREEFDRICHNLAVMASFNTTTTQKIAKQILLMDFYFCNGDIRIPMAKHVGLGVYKITSKRKYQNDINL